MAHEFYEIDIKLFAQSVIFFCISNLSGKLGITFMKLVLFTFEITSLAFLLATSYM